LKCRHDDFTFRSGRRHKGARSDDITRLIAFCNCNAEIVYQEGGSVTNAYQQFMRAWCLDRNDVSQPWRVVSIAAFQRAFEGFPNSPGVDGTAVMKERIAPETNRPR
jgi:hypothetical protein